MNTFGVVLHSTNQYSLAAGIKTLCYGDAGVGKTMLCATAPAPLIISAESGLLSLRHYNIPVIEIRTVMDLDNAYRWCLNAAEAKQYYTICIDSLSEIAEVVLAHAKAKHKDPRRAYSDTYDEMWKIIRQFRDLYGKAVYMTAKMEPRKDGLTGAIKYGASMPGDKFAPSVPFFYDEVFRLGIAQDQNGKYYRFLQTQPDLQYTAKDRSGSLDMYEPPDLTHVFTKILGV